MIKDTVALVPAAGLGTRLGMGPKAFLKLGGMTLLRRVIIQLSECVERIIVGVPASHLEQAQQEVNGLAEVYVGGSTRQETIFKLLQQSDEKIVLIHDVARPFASKNLINKVLIETKKHDAVVSLISSHSSIAYIENNMITNTFNRANIMLSQTPQSFNRNILNKAYQYAIEKGLETNTTWSLVLSIAIETKAVRGEETNIKITTPMDWEIAQKVIAPNLGWI